MRFWITRGSEVPLREQLVRQVLLAIVSEDLPAGHKLPSVREIARRYRIHANTVSAAYHDLLDRGWLELRRGSGLYVRPLPAADAGTLDSLLADTLKRARASGHSPEQVLQRLEQLVRPRRFASVVLLEEEPELRSILRCEIEEHLRVPVEESFRPDRGDCVAAVLATRAGEMRGRIPPGVPCIALRLNSVRKSLEGEPRPGKETIVAIVSRSSLFRGWARSFLLAVGLDAEALCEIDSSVEGWESRVGAGSLAIADAATAARVPKTVAALRVFRIVAETSLEELAAFFDCDAP